MGRFPPVVRTAVPVDGRFEHIVLSCNATSDHAIIWIEKEAQRALDVSVIVYWDKLSFILCLSFFCDFHNYCGCECNIVLCYSSRLSNTPQIGNVLRFHIG